MSAMGELGAAIGRFGWLIAGIGLLVAVTFLPPDTSFDQVRRAGALTACVPASRPPLVTGDPTRPGLEIELVTAIAEALGVRPVFNTIAAMGQDFDPSRWRITRAQCQLIGGGITDSLETRAFLDVTPAFGESGWVVLAKTSAPELSGRRAAVLVTSQGVDRVALSRFLRERDTMITLVREPADLATAIAEDRADFGVGDALSIEGLAGRDGLVASPLPAPLGARPLVLGLWKGDLTLKRAIVEAFERLKTSGRLDTLMKAYLGG
jgi:polar amino acid transport system substrate-binding protein/cystine transport system substrate-binding protein/membrane-bound lytic murein transglycosylase F